MQKKLHNSSLFLSSFGMLLPERTWTSDSASYRYGFNTQERDDEIYGAGNSTTAEYWQYDSRLGRRWNVDPVVYHNLSPYSCFANNPIVFVDIKGNEFEESSQDEANALRAKYEEKRNGYRETKQKNESKISKWEQKLSQTNNQRRINRLEKKINEYKSANTTLDVKISEMDAAISEWDEMNTSTQIFRIVLNYKEGTGRTTYDDGVIVLHYDGNMSMLAHEFKHGHQFINGEISFEPNGIMGGWLFDINDEVDAYRRQWAFDPNSTSTYFPNGYKDINPNNVRLIRNQDGTLKYAMLPSENIHSGMLMSEIEDIFKSNPFYSFPHHAMSPHECNLTVREYSRRRGVQQIIFNR